MSVRAGLQFNVKLEEVALPEFQRNSDPADTSSRVIKPSFANGLTGVPLPSTTSLMDVEAFGWDGDMPGLVLEDLLDLLFPLLVAAIGSPAFKASRLIRSSRMQHLFSRPPSAANNAAVLSQSLQVWGLRSAEQSLHGLADTK